MAATRREREKKKKKARKALLAFLRRLRQAARTYNTADELCDFVEELQPTIDEHVDVLSPIDQARLQRAMQVADVGREGVGKACDVLEFELAHIIDGLPAGGGVGLVIGAVIVVTTVLVGGAVAAVNAAATEIVIRNEGCNPIPLTETALPGPGWLLGAVGIRLPEEILDSGGEASITFPPVTIDVDGTGADKTTLSILGVKLPFDVGRNIQSLELDGSPLLGKHTRVRLGEQERHELVISCR